MDPVSSRLVQTSLPELSDEQIIKLNELLNIMRAESRPGDPPIPDDMKIKEIRSIPSFMRSVVWLLPDDAGNFVAYASAQWDAKAADNKHLLDAEICVHPEHRRNGIAKLMLARVAEVSAEQERPMLLADTNERVPAGAALMQRIGGEAAQQVRISRVMLDRVDRELLTSWVKEGPVRAPDYDLEVIDGSYPVERYDEIIECQLMMNTAPRDGLKIEDWTLTHEDLKSWDHELAVTGGRRLSLFARHRPSGKLVGFTEIGWNPSLAGLRFQYGTAVDPAHRGHALGKWLKAEMILRILDMKDDATEIRTGNAESNAAMLGINVAIGFEPYLAVTTWQVEAGQAVERLGAS